MDKNILSGTKQVLYSESSKIKDLHERCIHVGASLVIAENFGTILSNSDPDIVSASKQSMLYTIDNSLSKLPKEDHSLNELYETLFSQIQGHC